MLSKEENALYERQIRLEKVGIAGQERLKRAKVLVIGAGGLGCPVLRYLAAAGIGTLGIMDHDTVSKSNLHRQILFDYADTGKNKAEIAEKKIKLANPYIETQVIAKKLNPENALTTIRNYDLIIDCTDNYEARYLINDACVLENKPFISGAIYKFEGQVAVFNYNHGATYRCVYPKAPAEDSLTDCNSTGVIGTLPGIIALYQANEALKYVLQIGELLSKNILLINTLTNQQTLFKLPERKDHLYTDLLKTKEITPENYSFICATSITNSDEIDINQLEELYLKDCVQLIDVREFYEEPIIDNDKIEKIPLSELQSRINEISTEKDVVFFCKSGVRSRKAVEMIKNDFGLNNLKSLKNGISDELVEILCAYD